MMPISSLSKLALGFFACWHILLFMGSVYIFVFSIQDKRRINSSLRNILLLLLSFANYILFQFIVGFSSQINITDPVVKLIAGFSELPVASLIAVCTLLTILEIFLIYFLHHWHNTHITSASIKETIETLPVGICAFEPSGKITLRNKTMEQICRSLMEQPLLNGNEFVKMLLEKNSELTDFVVTSPEYGVWSFTKDEIVDGGNCFTLLIAYNVTEAYQKTQTLSNRQKTVQELNRKLISYNRQIEQVIAQQEILNAKVHIHDELGSCLLAIKHYLVSGGSDKERAALLDKLKENIRFLQQEAIPDVQDEFELILSTAKDLDVTVKIDRTLPQTEPNRHILATATHECFTNIIRHTNGDTLYVAITEIEDEGSQKIVAQFTDNNTNEVSDVTETGGLRSLRDLVERACGEMQISTKQRYCLTITLPKEAEKHDL